ncbi:MAG: hypothetical protein FJZ56_06735 [Chlamydiae bacterium]|nr:hypothetical protein [Chlamydiota bacterium]
MSHQTLLQHFDSHEDSSTHTRQALVDGYYLLNSLVQEINAKYKTSITLKDAANLVQANIAQFQLPLEAQSSLIALIEFIDIFESKINEPFKVIQPFASYIQPINFNAIIRLLKSKKMQKTKTTTVAASIALPDAFEGDLPQGLIIGSVEIFAGALLCIITSNVTWGIGSTLIADGISRIFDDLPDNTDIKSEM